MFTGTIGVDYFFSKSLIAGIAVGHAEADVDLINDSGSIESDGQYVAVYGSYQHGNFYANGLYSYGWQSMDLDRVANDEKYGADDIDSQIHSVMLDAGYNLFWNRVSYGPVVGIHYYNVQTDGYSESDSGYDLDGQTLESLVSELGVQASHTFYTEKGLIIPQIKAVWNHEFLDESETVDLSGSAAISADRLGVKEEDSYVVGCGLYWQSLNSSFNAGISFESHLRSGDNNSRLLSLSVSQAW